MFIDDYPYANIISEREAINIALREIPGTLLNIELDEEFGGLVYEVEVLHMGRKYEITISAHSGRVLDIEID